MSSFMKQGKRKEKIAWTKKHVKGFYARLEELNKVALAMVKTEEIDDLTEDRIVEIAADYTNMTIESLEKNILLAKIEDYKHRVKLREQAKDEI